MQQGKENQLPGTFSDEPKSIVDTSNIDTKNRLAIEERESLLSQLQGSGQIPIGLLEILRRIHSRTFRGPQATLEKIKAVLEMSESLRITFENGRVVYIGSGDDWEFAVALGAKDIDMVDPDFDGKNLRSSLFSSVQSFDPHASLIKVNGDTTIRFSIDIGYGIEQVSLHPKAMSVSNYIPSSPLVGVLEFAGPSKDIAPNLPIIPPLSRNLAPGAAILNFDYYGQYEPISDLRITPQTIGKSTIFKAY